MQIRRHPSPRGPKQILSFIKGARRCTMETTRRQVLSGAFTVKIPALLHAEVRSLRRSLSFAIPISLFDGEHFHAAVVACSSNEILM